MRSVLAIVVALAFISVPAFAASGFTARVLAEKDVIDPGEVALFTVEITNIQNVSDLFTISTPDFDWILDTSVPTSELPGRETQRTLIELAAKELAVSGPRVVRIKIRSANTGDFEQLNALVTVRNLNGTNRTYAPSIYLSASLSGAVDPRDVMTIPVYMRNRNARGYEKIQVQIQSDIFDKEYTTSLGPIGENGEKTNQVPIALDSMTPPGEHPLVVRIVVGDTVVNEYRTTFTIVDYEQTERGEDRHSNFFTYDAIYTVENKGNVPVETEVSHPTNFFRRLFTTATAEYTLKKVEEGSSLVFPLTLEPAEQAEITVSENYRLLFIFAVIVVLSVVSYFLFRSPVVLRKEAIILGGSTEGVNEIKLRLYIKNRSAKAVHNLHVIDRVSAMADVVKTHALGTLQPSKVVKKKGHGTLVRWDLDALDGFEERIITYTVKTELKLIGDVYLPALKVKFEQSGRERTAYSNEVNIPRDG